MDQDAEDVYLMLALLMIIHAYQTVFMTMMCAVTILSKERRHLRKKRRTNRDAVELLHETMKESSKTLIQLSENICKSFVEARRRESSHLKIAQELYTELMKVEGLTSDEIDRAHIRIAGSRNLLIGFSSIPDEFKAGWVHTLINKLI